MDFITNRKRHRSIAEPAVAAEVEQNRLRFQRGDATISLAEILYAIEHPGSGLAADEESTSKRRFHAAIRETAG